MLRILASDGDRRTYGFGFRCIGFVNPLSAGGLIEVTAWDDDGLFRLSQFNLAEQLGVSRQAVSKWEAGASKPSTENLKTLAALYDVPLEYLLNEDDPGPAHVGRRTGENTEVGHHKKPKRFALMLIGIGIMAVALWAVFFLSRGDEPNQMSHMNRSEVEEDNTGNFELEF